MNENIKTNDAVMRKHLDLVFVIDNSGSMEGEKIGAVNNAIRDVLNLMPEIQEDTSDADIYISALTFNETANWVYSEPKRADEFKWNDIGADSGTDYSLAFDKLNEFLRKESNGGKMPDFGGVAPIIIFMSDGMPTSPDWEEHLDTLRTRGWFKSALKYALAIEADSKEEIDILTKFTGNVETVLKVYTPESLRKIIKVIAVTASKVKSTNTMFAPKSNEGVIDSNKLAIEAVKESLEDLDSDDVVW